MSTKNDSYICIRKENRYMYINMMIKKRSKTPTCHVHVVFGSETKHKCFWIKVLSINP